MGQDKKLTKERLDELWAADDIRVLNAQSGRFVIMSDLHLGDGGRADDFRKNQQALLNALDHYRGEGFTVVLLGDIEEFWQFDLDRVAERYDSSVYQAFREFPDRRVIRVAGNHDIEWLALRDPTTNRDTRVHGAHEALKMKLGSSAPSILLVHGHQGSTDSDRWSWNSRYWVRVYKGIEPVLKLDRHSSATKSPIVRDYERIYYGWAKDHRIMVICGHSHRAIFASRSHAEILRDTARQLESALAEDDLSKKERRRLARRLAKTHEELKDEAMKERDIAPTEKSGTPLPCYFNTGCGLYSDGITVLAIDRGEISLVKWHRRPKGGENFCTLQGPGDLAEYLKQIEEEA